MTVRENIEAYAGTFFDSIEENTTEEELREWVKWDIEHAGKEMSEDKEFVSTHLEQIIEQLLNDQRQKFTEE